MANTFYWHDTGEELELLNRLWPLDVAAVQLLHQKPSHTSTVNGRRKRIYDKPATPWRACTVHRASLMHSNSRRPPESKGLQPGRSDPRQINAIPNL